MILGIIFLLYFGGHSYVSIINLLPLYRFLIFGLLLVPFCKSILERTQQPVTELSDDKPKEKRTQLDTHQVKIVESLHREFSNKGSRHITISGAFGVGKSSVINVFCNEIVNRKESGSKTHYICCNIDLWGVETNSIIQFVLGKVISTLAECIDMSGQRSLPQNYLSAMASGGGWFKFLNSFLKKQVSAEAIFLELSKILQVTNIHLIINIQDLDRNPNAEQSLNVLAGMLDRLKNQPNISYVFAAENTPIFSNTILRLCQHRWFMEQPSFLQKIDKAARELISQEVNGRCLPDNYYYQLNQRNSPCVELIDQMLSNYRAFESLVKEAQSKWTNLQGEVTTYDLFLILGLKNSYPRVLDTIVNIIRGDIDENKNVDELVDSYMTNSNLYEKSIFENSLIHLKILKDKADYLPNYDENNEPKTIQTTSLKNSITTLALTKGRIDIVISGHLHDGDFSYLEAYDVFIAAAENPENNFDIFAEKINSNLKEMWLTAFHEFGVYVFYESVKNEQCANRLMANIMKLDGELQHRVLNAFMVNKSERLNSSYLLKYLSSQIFIQDLTDWLNDFKYETLFDIGKIFKHLSLLRREGKEFKSIQTEILIDVVIRELLQSGTLMSKAVLCSGFISKEPAQMGLWTYLSDKTLNDLLTFFRELDEESILVETRYLYETYTSIQDNDLKDSIVNRIGGGKELIQSLINLKSDKNEKGSQS
ncbi:P-loop NTPase fold protein [Parashewanella tropica]|uniref:P-loop NTPase fold protein n=1 Tax=Parashewanella tropica TaxID=2547970 RepID=UPI001059C972|nr:P-loop NTPase fold protein [Parashewanella tropica]